MRLRRRQRFRTLAADPALKIACGRAPESDADLASQPTISRLENGVESKDIYCIAVQIARRIQKAATADPAARPRSRQATPALPAGDLPSALRFKR